MNRVYSVRDLAKTSAVAKRLVKQFVFSNLNDGRGSGRVTAVSNSWCNKYISWYVW